jgi:O-methyltransferase
LSNLENIKNEIKTLEFTLLPIKTLENIEYCIREVVKNNIEGDFLEAGVWRGGAVIYAYHVLKELKSDKKIYCADSFMGLPKPNIEKYPIDRGDPHWEMDGLKITKDEVIKNFKIFGDISENIIFLEGWFKDTLYTAKIEKLSVLRLDGDMYESTWESLDALYPKLSIGGYCIIDDYGHFPALFAVNDYRKIFDIQEPLIRIDDDPRAYPSVYWKKLNKEYL